MYALRKDTLAGLKQSSLFEARKVDVALPFTVARLNAYMNNYAANVKPEAEAIKFYFANHVFSLIAQHYAPHEPLPEAVYPLARGYVKLASDLTVRLVYYTLQIITREARHFPGPSSLLDKVGKECGAEVGNFFKKMGGGEEGILDRLRHNPPNVLLERYLRGVVMVFNDTDQWPGSYGGPMWGNIAETLRRVVIGELSAEMFADTAFTLAHNGGPMFNKGMLYHYDGHPSNLYKILDVQRSGQIPQMTPHEIPKGILLDNPTKDYIAAAKKVFPADLEGYVDWFKVEALGALKSYPTEKEKQVLAHGASVWQSAEEKTKAEKHAAAQAKIQASQAAAQAAEKSKFYVGPGEDDFAVVVERKAA